MPDQGKLAAYADLVRSWAPRLDLISPGDLDRFEERHVADSLRLLPLIAELPPGPCVDVGSGAGLPGIPLAIASDRHWRFLEPRHKRAAFLEEAVRELALDCEVLAITAEEATLRPDLRGAHALAVARAVARPSDALELLRPLVSAAGWAVVFVGKRAEIPANAEEWAPGIATMPGSQEGVWE